MLHRYLILHGLQKLIPAKFREKYPELAVGRRRRRQDVTADEEAQEFSKITFVLIFEYVYVVCYFVHYLGDRQDARVDPWLM
jgi:hypothetical protein